MLRGLLLSAALLAGLPAAAQDAQSLADIRAELATLAGQIQGLRQELVASGAQGLQAAGGASALERMDTMEAALSRLTSRTEALENRINAVVADGTNRIGDLEFRLCEMEEGCDIGALGQASVLGGAASANPVTAPAPNATKPAGASLAMNEQADFDRAKSQLDNGDYAGAAAGFKAFNDAYPGGPLAPEAAFLRGDALKAAGDTTGAARAWLESFNADKTGARAPEALLKLGQALGEIGQKPEACATLDAVSTRFPGTAPAGQVAAAKTAIGCP
jgi:tol-pal system protein YbgF